MFTSRLPPGVAPRVIIDDADMTIVTLMFVLQSAVVTRELITPCAARALSAIIRCYLMRVMLIRCLRCR